MEAFQMFLLIGNVFIAAGLVITGLKGRPVVFAASSFIGLVYVTIGAAMKVLG